MPMLVAISEIKINSGRRNTDPDGVKDLAKSISEIGLLNPITITADKTLIAGCHRLEAAKLLGWTEIECTVCDMNGLLAELAEIDENFVRVNLSPIEFGDLLLRRKEIYEKLHPETKSTGEGGPFRGNQHKEVSDKMTLTTKSFTQDTADRLGVGKRTIERDLQAAKKLTPAAKRIIRQSDTIISKTDALKLSRLAPDQQEQAATQLATGEIHSMNEYQKPYSIGGKHFSSFEESIADLKNPNKDASYTPGTLLADMDGLIDRFHRDFSWYEMDQCTVVFPEINREQFDYITKRFATITSAIEEMLQKIGRSIDIEEA